MLCIVVFIVFNHAVSVNDVIKD